MNKIQWENYTLEQLRAVKRTLESEITNHITNIARWTAYYGISDTKDREIKHHAETEKNLRQLIAEIDCQLGNPVKSVEKNKPVVNMVIPPAYEAVSQLQSWFDRFCWILNYRGAK